MIYFKLTLEGSGCWHNIVDRITEPLYDEAGKETEDPQNVQNIEQILEVPVELHSECCRNFVQHLGCCYGNTWCCYGNAWCCHGNAWCCHGNAPCCGRIDDLLLEIQISIPF